MLKVYVHGRPQGQDIWSVVPVGDDKFYLNPFLDSKIGDGMDAVLLIDVWQGNAYYSYIHRKNVSEKGNRPNAYFAITICFEKHLCTEVSMLYDLLDSVYKQLCLNNIIEKVGEQERFLISQFKEKENVLNQVNTVIVQNVNKLMVHNLISLEASSTVAGVGIQDGNYAIAKELRIGDMIVTDVPFYVIDITTNNERADKYVDCFNIIVGSELMLQLKDLTIDFVNHEITVPSVAPKRSQASPNMCFSSHMNLLGTVIVQGNPVLMNMDTGDASYGSLDSGFFESNKEYITTNCKLDTIRTGGIGGVQTSECYNVPNISIGFGKEQVLVPEIVVKTGNSTNAIVEYEGNLGLKSLMLFSKVRFNLVDFVLTTFNQE
jgi:hypothetical protein